RLAIFGSVSDTLNAQLFPYTTLFRSNSLISSASYSASSRVRYALRPKNLLSIMTVNSFVGNFGPESYSYCWMVFGFGSTSLTPRSEENTSELQSRENIVFSLLLVCKH